MAQAGFTSSLRAIEAPRGFAHVLSTEQHFEKMTEGLGTVWHTLENSFKPYACGLVIHPIIDGCLTLRQQHQFSSDDVKQIDLKVHPLVLELTGKSAPTTGLEGKFSVQHSAAIVTHEGKSQARQYSDAAVQDPAVTKLRSKVQVAIEPGLRVDEAKVTVVLNDGRVLPAFIGQAIQKTPLSVFGDGTHTRSFCYVDDFVEGIVRLLNSDYSGPVNIGNPEEITINQFAQEILKITQSDSPINYHPLPVDDPKQRKPDITLAQSLLHWEPKVNREEGLRKTLQYFSQQIQDHS
jgi:hypothetical protein